MNTNPTHWDILLVTKKNNFKASCLQVCILLGWGWDCWFYCCSPVLSYPPTQPSCYNQVSERTLSFYLSLEKETSSLLQYWLPNSLFYRTDLVLVLPNSQYLPVCCAVPNSRPLDNIKVCSSRRSCKGRGTCCRVRASVSWCRWQHWTTKWRICASATSEMCTRTRLRYTSASSSWRHTSPTWRARWKMRRERWALAISNKSSALVAKTLSDTFSCENNLLRNRLKLISVSISYACYWSVEFWSS